MAIQNSLALSEFLDLLLKKTDEILENGVGSTWKNLPKYILIFLKLRALFPKLKLVGPELSGASQPEMDLLMAELRAKLQQVADMIDKYETQEVSAPPTVEGILAEFNEEDVKKALEQELS